MSSINPYASLPYMTATSSSTRDTLGSIAEANAASRNLFGLSSVLSSTKDTESTMNRANQLGQGITLDLKDVKADSKLARMTPAEAAAAGFIIKNGNQVLVDGTRNPFLAGTNNTAAFQQNMGTSFNTNPIQGWNVTGTFSPYDNSSSSRLSPFLYAQGTGSTLEQENAQLKALLFQMTNGQIGYESNSFMPTQNNALDPAVILSLMQQYGINMSDLASMPSEANPIRSLVLPLVK